MAAGAAAGAACVASATLAADLPVIGRDRLPREPKPSAALLRECNKPIPPKENERQYMRRLNLQCPGRLE